MPRATMVSEEIEDVMAPRRDQKKRMGKKHRQASTRPKKGRAPKVAPTTGAIGTLRMTRRRNFEGPAIVSF